MTDGIRDAYHKGDVSLESLFNDADEIESAILDLDIFKDDKLDSLRGIPFAIVGGTFRERIVDGKYSDFVTLVCMIPNVEILEKRRIRYTNTELWFPEQTFGINDGSTGIRRQVVAHLHNIGYIQAVEDGTVIVESGGRGECTWDKRVSEWEHRDGGHTTTKDDKGTGVPLMSWDFQLERALVAPRGIRTSTYKGRFGKDNVTRYLG
jgi:hypothetical protein